MQHKNPTISKGIDWPMVWLYAILVIFGIVCIYSVEYKSTDNFVQTLIGFKKNYSKQLFFFGASAILAIFILLTDSKFFTATSNISYLVGMLLILATFVVGKETTGLYEPAAGRAVQDFYGAGIIKIFINARNGF
jgi:rod shape determining protein RodA